MKEIVAGLDIGTTKIACIIAEKDENGGIKILGIGVAPSTGLRRGVVENIDKTVEGIKQAVEQAEVLSGVDVEEVYVGIAGEHIRSYNHSGAGAVKGADREITQEDVDRVIETAKAIPTLDSTEIIHTVPQSFTVDNQANIKDPIGMCGTRLEVKVHIVTAAVNSVKNLKKCVENAGLEVAAMVLEPYASSYAVLEQDEKDVGVALVDMGGGTTDIAIYSEDGLMQTYVVDAGGEYVTKDIGICLRIALPNAEDIKKKYGSADPEVIPADDYFSAPGVAGREERQVQRKLLAEIINARVVEILTKASKRIEDSGCREMLGAGIVLTGGGADLEKIDDVAQSVFGMPVKKGVPLGFTGLSEEAVSPRHATGIGLCLYGFDHSKDGNGKNRSSGPKSSFWESLVNFFQKYI